MIPKFRAWHHELGRMMALKSMWFQDSCLEELELNDSVMNDYITAYPDEVELMQSTGAVDKNGKEIFEGDIIRTNAYGCIVGFGEYTYFEDENSPITEIGFYLSFLNVKPATYAPFDKYYWANCEVIGNIYENELDLIVYEAYKYNKETSEDKE